MRNRMSGGVRGRRQKPSPTRLYLSVKKEMNKICDKSILFIEVPDFVLVAYF